MNPSLLAHIAESVSRQRKLALVTIAVGIPFATAFVGASLDHGYRDRLFSLDGLFGSLLFAGPFLIVAIAALRPGSSKAAWGMLCVGLAFVVVLLGAMRTVGDGGGASQGSLGAGIALLALNGIQYVAAVCAALAGCGWDLWSWMRRGRNADPHAASVRKK